MAASRSHRAGTRIEWRLDGNHAELQDVCVIRRDERNPGYWVALSIKTGKAGMGKRIGDAYIALCVELALALRRLCETRSECTLELADYRSHWSTEWDSLQQHTRVSQERQKEWLRIVQSRVLGKPPDDVGFEGLEDLGADYVELSGETHLALSPIVQGSEKV